MKKMILYIFLFIFIFCLSYKDSIFAQSKSNNQRSSSSQVEVRVTQKVPGANCKVERTAQKNVNGAITGGDVVGYICNIEKGANGVLKIIGAIIKYLTYIAGLCMVLFIIIAGIMYSMSGVDDSMKSSAKEKIIGALLGFLLLVFGGVLLNYIAPWVYV